MTEPRGVLVTRPEPDATETAAIISGRGWLPVVAPVLTIIRRPSRPAAPCDAVLLTSGNALQGLGPEWWDTLVLAVGDRTAARAIAAGFRRVLSAAGDAVALSALVRAQCPAGARLLLPAGAGQGYALGADLRAAGFQVVRRTVYDVEQVFPMPNAAIQAFECGALHAALFLSLRTVGFFVALMPPTLYRSMAQVDALVIGGPAADMLATLPWRSVRVSAKPNLEHVLALL